MNLLRATSTEMGHVCEAFNRVALSFLRLHLTLRNNGKVGLCGSCMDARGIEDTELSAGAERSSMDELAQWTQWADKVLVF